MIGAGPDERDVRVGEVGDHVAAVVRVQQPARRCPAAAARTLTALKARASAAPQEAGQVALVASQ
jgi:hypothetical protein